MTKITFNQFVNMYCHKRSGIKFAGHIVLNALISKCKVGSHLTPSLPTRDLAEITGLAQSTVRRSLNTLLECGLIELRAGERYEIMLYDTSWWMTPLHRGLLQEMRQRSAQIEHVKLTQE